MRAYLNVFLKKENKDLLKKYIRNEIKSSKN